MKYAVYWNPGDDPEWAWFKTFDEAYHFANTLISKCEDSADEGKTPNWEITVLAAECEAREIPFDGSYKMVDVRY